MKVPSRFRKNEYCSLIIEFARILEPEVYCELGVYQCFTINRLLPYVGHAIGIDIADKRKHFDKTWKNWEFYKMDSEKFSGSYKGPLLDLVFIDADHAHESVLDDIHNLTPLIKPHTGILLLHDTYPIQEGLLHPGHCNDAWKAAKKIHQEFAEWEIVTIPKPWAGLSILRRTTEGSHGWMDCKRGV